MDVFLVAGRFDSADNNYNYYYNYYTASSAKCVL